MRNAWFVRPQLDDTNMIEWFKAHNVVATKVKGVNLDADSKSSIDLGGKSVEEINEILSQEPYLIKDGELGNIRLSLDLFVNQMKVGDLVLVPDGRTIYFARIVGDYRHQSSIQNPIRKDIPMPRWLAHQRKVTWLNNVPRDELSDELRVALKNRRPVGDLSKFHNEIEARSQGLPYEPKKETCEIAFKLRPGFIVTYTIPTDMTDMEAERLSVDFRNNYFKREQTRETSEQ